MKAPITSKKHIVQISQGTIAQSAVEQTNLVEAIEAQASTPTQVQEGAVVKAIYVELWLGNASTSVVGSYTTILYKNPGGGHTATAAEVAALHDYTNKKNILFTSQALVPPTDGGQVVVLRQWVKIPKGKQRMGLNDKIQLVTRNNNSTSVSINFCGLSVYKEYT